MTKLTKKDILPLATCIIILAVITHVIEIIA